MNLFLNWIRRVIMNLVRVNSPHEHFESTFSIINRYKSKIEGGLIFDEIGRSNR